MNRTVCPGCLGPKPTFLKVCDACRDRERDVDRGSNWHASVREIAGVSTEDEFEPSPDGPGTK